MTTSNPIQRVDDRGDDYDRLKFRGILEAVTLHQKGTQVRFWFPARIPASHDLPWNWLLENVK